jgi:hypothetical protein
MALVSDPGAQGEASAAHSPAGSLPDRRARLKVPAASHVGPSQNANCTALVNFGGTRDARRPVRGGWRCSADATALDLRASLRVMQCHPCQCSSQNDVAIYVSASQTAGVGRFGFELPRRIYKEAPNALNGKASVVLVELLHPLDRRVCDHQNASMMRFTDDRDVARRPLARRQRDTDSCR